MQRMTVRCIHCLTLFTTEMAGRRCCCQCFNAHHSPEAKTYIQCQKCLDETEAAIIVKEAAELSSETSILAQ